MPQSWDRHLEHLTIVQFHTAYRDRPAAPEILRRSSTDGRAHEFILLPIDASRPQFPLDLRLIFELHGVDAGLLAPSTYAGISSVKKHSRGSHCACLMASA